MDLSMTPAHSASSPDHPHMHQNPNSADSSRKRRAIRACASCRTSKVKCDGDRPCARCSRSGIECQYFETVKDATAQRLEYLEGEVGYLRNQLDSLQRGADQRAPQSNASTVSSNLLTPASSALKRPFIEALQLPQPRPSMARFPVPPSSVDKGLITWEQASFWFLSFFSGSHMYVPVFCANKDTPQSISSRCPFLFDAIVSIGCRAEEGPRSVQYETFQPHLREHLSKLLIQQHSTPPTIEIIQAIAVLASFSENGWTLIAIAIRMALEMGVPDAVERLMSKVAFRSTGYGSSSHLITIDEEEKDLYRIARVWYGVLNLEYIFSLDGGRPPSIAFVTSSRRIRALASHVERTSVDIRLLSQVELNIIRSTAYETLKQRKSTSEDNESVLRTTIRETCIDLNFWLEEWSSISSKSTGSAHQKSLALLSLQIQHAWALITLHLQAVSGTGIDNIALMAEFQRDMVRTAKEAAVKHLELLIRASATPPPSALAPGAASPITEQRSSYLATFKWAMDFVWAKCAFSILLALKLALLLRDPPDRLMNLLRDAHGVLEQLKNVTVGHTAYFRILQTGVEKCEKALKEYMRESSAMGSAPEDQGKQSHTAESDFQGYAPREFQFEWDFPGLNLRHMPLGWQDLFLEFDTMFS